MDRPNPPPKVNPDSPHRDPIDPTRRLTYSVPEVATLLGISRTKAYECIHTGELPSLRLGRRVVIPARALEALLGPIDAA